MTAKILDRCVDAVRKRPVKVQSVSGATLILEDGRTFHVDTLDDEQLDQIIQESDFMVDVDSDAGDSNVVIYAKRRGWICGTPWVGGHVLHLLENGTCCSRRA